MAPSNQIRKAGGILIQGGCLLVARSKGSDTFFAPGGEVEPGETDREAMLRQLQQGLLITARAYDLEHFGEFSHPAAGRPETTVCTVVYRIKTWRGWPKPSSEVEELAWIDSKSRPVKLDSIVREQILPRLVIAGRVI